MDEEYNLKPGAGHPMPTSMLTATEAAMKARLVAGGAQTTDRQPSEVEMLMNFLDQEVSALGQSLNVHTSKIEGALAPEAPVDKMKDEDPVPNPSSRIGERLYNLIYTTKAIRDKLNETTDRVRI